MVLFPPLHVGCPLGFALEAALEDLGWPPSGPGVEMVQLLASQDAGVSGSGLLSFCKASLRNSF